MPRHHLTRLPLLLATAWLAVTLAACNNPPPEESAAPEEPAPTAPQPDVADSKRLINGADRLIAAMNKPTEPFHVSFKSRENLVGDKSKPPQMGAVNLQADLSPLFLNLIATRGGIVKTVTARQGDETNWGAAHVTALGVLTNLNFVIALGATVAPPPSTDLVGKVVADKFVFDTAVTLPGQALGLEAARAVQPAIKDCRGTAWIAEQSGVLVKFNVDAEYEDQYDHTWEEHYEGEVTPK